MQLLSIEYQLAPDNPYPAALDNCRDALQWAHSPAGRIELRSPLSGRDGRRGFDNCRTRL
ncbi:esterase/lipase [Penicillium vulpinum]|uniref:esterase/lipase n=1 Tax=Penicillium vulpinum TaxID=29845 RepID=UPI002547F3C6|nr:esterase/lipase [Penicillium vulpinum]KAJ5964577.1 esterase/lipase [Penicillium vulpinum]